jgi:hypothetical protein
MNPSRHIRVKATSEADAKSGTTCKTFTAKPLLYVMAGEDCTEIEVDAELVVVNNSEDAISEGDELSVCQDISGFWLVLSGGGGGGTIEYKIESTVIPTSGPYTGLKVASVMIHGAPCGRESLVGTAAEVVDHSNELFDETSMAGYTGWAAEMVFLSLDATVECGTMSPCHWAAINRVCSPNTGTYAEPCEEE